MEDNNTVTKDISSNANINAETQFLLLTMSYLECKIGKVSNGILQSHRSFEIYEHSENNV